MNEPAEEEVKPSSGCGAVSSSPSPAVAKVATVVTLTNPQSEDSTLAGRFDCLGGCCCYRDFKQVETSVETDRLISTNFIDQQHSGYVFSVRLYIQPTIYVHYACTTSISNGLRRTFGQPLSIITFLAASITSRPVVKRPGRAYRSLRAYNATLMKVSFLCVESPFLLRTKLQGEKIIKSTSNKNRWIIELSP